MIVTLRIGDADANDDVAQERRIGECMARAPKVVGRMKRDLVYPGFEPFTGKQRRIGAPLGVGRRGREPLAVGGAHDVEVDDQALCRHTARRIEHMCREAGHYRLSLTPRHPYGGAVST